MDVLSRLNREEGLTIVLVTHQLRLVRPVVGAVIWVDGGTAIKGPTATMLAPERILDVFGALATG